MLGLAELVPPQVDAEVRIDVESVVVRLALLHVAEALGRSRCSHQARCACPQVADRGAPGSVIDVLVTHDDPLSCQRAIDAAMDGRARAVVLWDEPHALGLALDAVARRSLLLPARVLELAASAPRLSARQERTLRLVALGRSNPAIAASLHQSLSTTKRDLAELLEVFDVPNRAALMSRATALGFGCLSASARPSPG